jgi:hypothetical protein
LLPKKDAVVGPTPLRGSSIVKKGERIGFRGEQEFHDIRETFRIRDDGDVRGGVGDVTLNPHLARV